MNQPEILLPDTHLPHPNAERPQSSGAFPKCCLAHAYIMPPMSGAPPSRTISSSTAARGKRMMPYQGVVPGVQLSVQTAPKLPTRPSTVSPPSLLLTGSHHVPAVSMPAPTGP